MNIYISNKHKKYKANIALSRQIIQKVLDGENDSHAVLSVIICDDMFIQRMNCQYLAREIVLRMLSLLLQE